MRELELWNVFNEGLYELDLLTVQVIVSMNLILSRFVIIRFEKMGCRSIKLENISKPSSRK